MGCGPILPQTSLFYMHTLLTLCVLYGYSLLKKKKKEREIQCSPHARHGLCLLIKFENHHWDCTGEKCVTRVLNHIRFVSVIKTWKVSTKICILFYKIKWAKVVPRKRLNSVNPTSPQSVLLLPQSSQCSWSVWARFQWTF